VAKLILRKKRSTDDQLSKTGASNWLRILRSPVATGIFGGLRPPKQSSKPSQIETWNTINKLCFGYFYNIKPPKQTQSPLLKSFWRRFWYFVRFVRKFLNIKQLSAWETPAWAEKCQSNWSETFVWSFVSIWFKLDYKQVFQFIRYFSGQHSDITNVKLQLSVPSCKISAVHHVYALSYKSRRYHCTFSSSDLQPHLKGSAILLHLLRYCMRMKLANLFD